MDYDGKCRWLHGHNYVMKVGLSDSNLDDRGFVRDFGEVKKEIKEFIDEHIDHGMILNSLDYEWIDILRKKENRVYTIEGNPTAENMAKHFYYIFKGKFPEISYIILGETPTSVAYYSEEK